MHPLQGFLSLKHNYILQAHVISRALYLVMQSPFVEGACKVAIGPVLQVMNNAIL